MNSTADTAPDSGAGADVTRRHVLAALQTAMKSVPVGLVIIELRIEAGTGKLIDTDEDLRAEVERRLVACLTESDELVSANVDRFLIVKRKLSGPAETEGLALRLLQAIREPRPDKPEQRTIQSAIGVAVSHAKDDAEDLLRYAEHALADAHMLGGDRVVCFEDADRELLP